MPSLSPSEQVPELDDRAVYSKPVSRLEKLREVFRHLRHSLHQVYEDGVHFVYLRDALGGKQQLGIQQLMDYQRIRTDLLKFVPYSFFIVVPMAEFLIPFYIWLFPNSTPSQFLFETKLAEQNSQKETKQKNAVKLLRKRLEAAFPEKMKKLTELVAALKKDPLNRALEEELLAQDREIAEELINNWQTRWVRDPAFERLTLRERESALRVFFTDFVSGKHIANELLNLPTTLSNLFAKYVSKSNNFRETRSFQFELPLLREARSKLLERQLEAHFRELALEDRAIDRAGGLDELSPFQSHLLLRRRGAKILDPRERAPYYRQIWRGQASSQPDPMLALWLAVLRFSYADRLV